MRKKTDEEFREELKQKRPDIIQIDKYINAVTEITVKCKECGNIFKASPNGLLGGVRRCRVCGLNKQLKSSRKTNDEFLEELSEINPSIEPLEEYTNAKTKIKVRCKICNHIWSVRPSSLVNSGKGCPICSIKNRKINSELISKKLTKTNKQYLEELKQANPNLEALEKYVGSNIKMKFLCKVCKHIFYLRSRSALSGRGCPECSKKIKIKKLRKTTEKFSSEIKNINPNFELLDEYKDSKSKVRIKCKTCGTIKLIEPNSTLSLGYIRCNTCNPNGSIEEQRLADNIKLGINNYIKLKEEEKMAKKLTNEEFLKRFNAKYQGRIVALTEYINYSTKIKFKCNKCGDIFYAKGYDMLQYKHGCANCNGTKKRTNEEFLELMEEVNPNIEVLEEYVNNTTKLKCRCKICGNEWYSMPKYLLSGMGCNNKECISEKIRNSKLKYDTENFKKIAKENYPNLELLDEYYSYDIKVKFLCKNCGEIWEVNPSSIIRKTLGNCPTCSRKILSDKYRKTNGEFLEELKQINPNIDILEDYKNANTEISFRCNTCGYTFKTTPGRILHTKHGCPRCAIKYRTEKQTKKDSIFKNEISEINPDIEILEDYKTSHIKLKVRCKKCKTEFKIMPYKVISRQSILCRTCNPTGSLEEQRLADNISKEISKQSEELNNLYKMERNVRMSDLSGRQFEIDIYFPNMKIGIEYDGVYYHNDKVRYARYILDKKEFFWNNFGIHIIFVNSIEYTHNPDIIQDKIMSAINIYKKSGYARRLKVVDIDYETSTEFLEKNHLQGGDNSSIRFGLVTKKKNILVALMTFSKVRNIVKSKIDSDETYELVRYCVMKGLKITGGFSKLLKYAEKYLQSIGVKYIKTFADRRFTKDTDNVYLRNGFEMKNISGQNYIYFKEGETLTRYQCQKHKLKKLLGEENFDESQTERDNMLNNGYSVYWDCGNLVYYKEIK